MKKGLIRTEYELEHSDDDDEEDDESDNEEENGCK
jgi:hypothetical protein